MLLLYHQNLEKKTVKSTQNIFIRSIGFFIRQGSCPCKASAAKKKMQKQAAKKSAQSTKQGIKSASKAIQQIGKIMTSIVQSVAANPVVWIVLLVVLLMAVIVGAIGAVIGSGGAANSAEDYTYQAQVSEQTESYRDMVVDYCEKYGIDDYVDLCLAVIEQESGGNPPDVMQTEQSYYNVNPPIDTAEESIDCGTHELSDCLTKAKSKSPNDIKGISLALQGYNFGNGYIDWALKNYGCYSKENAEIFSQKMCVELGYDSYGDVEYVPHVLRYYIANPETTVTNESANSILKELKENIKKHIDLLCERYPALKIVESDIAAAYQILEDSYRNGGKLLVAGNGGSAADAEHIVGELMKGFKLPRKPQADFAEKLVRENKELGTVLAENLQGALPAIALDGHPALSTAYMNDCEPLLCFAQQVNGYGKEGDVFLGISTSGNSKNILYAATTAHAKGMKVIGLTGAKNSKLEQMSDVCIKVPQTETYMIQELHLPVYHCLCLMLEDEFFN